MKIAFFSNFLNHHQLPLCQELVRLTEGAFTFVASTPVPEERLALGYAEMNSSPFVLREYESNENRIRAMQLALESDVIVTGSAPEVYTRARIEAGRLTFRYQERVYKNGYIHALSPRAQRNLREMHRKYSHAPLYMLCASAYTAGDFALSGCYRNKAYRWGYFPEVKEQELPALFARKAEKAVPRILWVARLIPLKHPEAALRVALELKRQGRPFSMELIGAGPLEAQLRQQVQENGLADRVTLTGAMPPEEVRRHMEQADVFLFTSDFGEGWGAVLNESMNSGCAVIASHAIGSAGFLLKNGENGFIYPNGDQKALTRRVVQLLDDAALRRRLGENAYRTMAEQWSPAAAAGRLVTLSSWLLEHPQGGSPFAEGPCSPAPQLTNGRAARLLCKD